MFDKWHGNVKNYILYLKTKCCNIDIFNSNNFRYPEKISKVVAHAGQSYISETDMENDESY